MLGNAYESTAVALSNLQPRPATYRLMCEPFQAGTNRVVANQVLTLHEVLSVRPDGTGELTNKSRVSLHWSSKGDGNFDKHTVFVDNLKLPRMILPLGPGELLINETDTQDIYLWRDKDGDGVADEKKLWYAGGPRGGNMEHQQSGLVWCTDNWLYMTYNAWRLRWQGYDKEPLKESTPGNGGQWGLTQDDWGKPWYVNAGGERGPLNFQTHIYYAALNAKDQFVGEFATVWPLVPIPDVQGGPNR